MDAIFLRYGDKIRLWGKSSVEVNSAGEGFIGKVVKTSSWHREGRPPRRVLYALPPTKERQEGANWTFTPEIFKVTDFTGLHQEGEKVCYGDEVLLVDSEGLVMNSFHIPRGTLKPQPPGAEGKVTVAFHHLITEPSSALTREKMNDPVFYGDEVLLLAYHPGLRRRPQGKPISHMKRRRDLIQGRQGMARLRADGKGTVLAFTVHDIAPAIQCIKVTIKSSDGQGAQLSHSSYNVSWGEGVTFEVQSGNNPQVQVVFSSGAGINLDLPGIMGNYLPNQDQVEKWLKVESANQPTCLKVSCSRVAQRMEHKSKNGLADLVSSEQTLKVCSYLAVGVLVSLFLLVRFASDPGSQGNNLALIMDWLQSFEDPSEQCKYSSFAREAGHRTEACCLSATYEPVEWTTVHIPTGLSNGPPLHVQGKITIEAFLKQLQGFCFALSLVFVAFTAAWKRLLKIENIVIEGYAIKLIEWRPGNLADIQSIDSCAGVDSNETKEVPITFILAEFGDVEAGRARWHKTLAWRAEVGADIALKKPHTKFEIFKRCYPSYFYGRDRVGNFLYIERIGLVDVEGMRRNGIAFDDLLWHYMYMMEYIWTVIAPSYDDRMTVILDIEFVKLRDFAGETLQFVKSAVGMNSTHYPQRSHKVFIINAPRWFSIVWNVVKNLLHEVTRQKVSILDSNYKDALLETIAPDNLPSIYGGTGPEPTETNFENEFKDFVYGKVRENGLEMQAFC